MIASVYFESPDQIATRCPQRNRYGTVCCLGPAIVEQIGGILTAGAGEGQVVGGVAARARREDEESGSDQDPDDDDPEPVARRE